MSESTDDLERTLESHFAQERERTQAPASLWSRVEARVDAGAAPRTSLLRRRWRALAATVGAAAAIAAGFFVLSSVLGGDGPPSADDVLAGALDTLANPESVGLHSYQGVAEIVVPAYVPGMDDSSEQTGPDGEPIIVAEIPNDATRAANQELRVWFKGPDRYRFEIDNAPESPEPPGDRLLLTDGESFWSYTTAANQYSVSPADAPDSSSDIRFFFAPAAFSGATGITDLLTTLASDSAHQAVLAGEDTVLGRPAYRVEVSPAYSGSRTGSAGADEEYSGGVVRMWLDKEFLFMLRMETDAGPDEGSFEMRFRQIEFNSDVSDDLFQFNPPPGAVEVDSDESQGAMHSSGSGGIGGDLGQRVDLPAGFLAPTYFLSGYQTQSIDQSYEDNDPPYEVKFLIEQTGGTGYISAHERRGKGDLPEALKQGQATSIRGSDGWLRTDGDLLHLAWQEGDLVVYLIARDMSAQDLLRVVDSMQRSAGPGAITPDNEPPGDSASDHEGGEAEAVPAQSDSP